MRRRLLIGLPLLLAIAIGVIAASADSEFPPAEPAPLDPALAAWVPLEVGEPRTFDVVSTNMFPHQWTRVVAGWEAVDGQAHARVDMDWSAAKTYRREWLRPGRGPAGEAQLLCTLRQLDAARHRLEPPQPILQTPLTVGATWTWSGRIGENPCEATFRIVALDEDTLRVEQHTVAGKLSSTHVRTYARGRGLVAESADLPTNDPTMVKELQQTATEAEAN